MVIGAVTFSMFWIAIYITKYFDKNNIYSELAMFMISQLIVHYIYILNLYRIFRNNIRIRHSDIPVDSWNCHSIHIGHLHSCNEHLHFPGNQHHGVGRSYRVEVNTFDVHTRQ